MYSIVAVDSSNIALIQGRTHVLSRDNYVPENTDGDDFPPLTSTMIHATKKIENNKFYSSNVG